MTGGDKKGTKPARMSGLIIQLVGEDKKFGWEIFPILIAMGPSKETPKLPEGEDIKKEVWSQLGRMVGHTNVRL